MSSYRDAGAAWDGGPPGAEAEYAGQRAPVPAFDQPAAPAMPTTDPWTGVSYSQYGAAPAYEYQAYGAAAAGYSYNYDSTYYQRTDSSYYGKYPDAGTYPLNSAYEYPARHGDKSHSPSDTQRYDRRRSYRSKSRSVSPYTRRERDSSYEERRHRRSRSKSLKRKKYSSSDRSSSRSRSYSHSSLKRDKKKRSLSSASSTSDKSYRKNFIKNRGRDHTPPPRDKHSSSCGRTPSMDRSLSKSPKQKKKSKDTKSHSNKDKRQRKVSTPPRKRKESAKSPKRQKKTERSTLTPPRVYKLKDNRSDSPDEKSRENSLTPPKTYARNASLSSKSQSRSLSPRPSKRRRSHSRSSGPSRSRSFSRSRSSTPARRSHSKSKRKNKRKSRSKSRSNRRSVSKSRSRSRRRSKSRGKGKCSVSPSGSKSRSISRSSRSRSRSGSPTDDERRGQFTVADRKRFWKLHRNRQEEREKEAKTPPKEIKPPPPGVVDATTLDDIEYRDPPEVEGPNFAELLQPPDQVMQASSSKSKAMPIPIKNDGSFLEMFKKMQGVTKKAEETEKKPEIKKPALPFIGKRRGGRVLKTGLVKKAKAIDEQTADNAPKDAWSLYMQEVKKYRETSCEEERKTRPLVK